MRAATVDDPRPLYWFRFANLTDDLLGGVYTRALTRPDAEDKARSIALAIAAETAKVSAIPIIHQAIIDRIPPAFRDRLLTVQECDFVDDLILGMRTFKPDQ